MKKKIMIFMLMFSFLVGVGVPDQAKAATETTNTYDDVKYNDIEEFMHSIGHTSFVKEEGYSYMFITGSQSRYYYLYKIKGDKNSIYVGSRAEGGVLFVLPEDGVEVTRISYYSYDHSMPNFNNWEPQGTDVYNNVSGYVDVRPDNPQVIYFTHNGYDRVRYSDLDIYVCTYSDSTKLLIRGYDTLLYESNLEEGYNFQKWCTDAGLNCAASSLESSSVIPFFYEPDNYNYIVSKNITPSSTSYIYNLLMVQKTDGAHYPYHFQVNDIEYLGLAGAFADISIFTVRKFYYDPDGEGWKLIQRHDVKELPFDHADFTFDENTVFIYSDTDIYSDRAASSVWQPASTEYYNVEIPEVEIPTITTIPSGGSGSIVGGQAKPGGMLDFIITFFTLVWTKLFAVEVPVDGYSISFQAIVIFGAIAGVLIWLGKSSFGKKG